jgi:hypothetical protein
VFSRISDQNPEELKNNEFLTGSNPENLCFSVKFAGYEIRQNRLFSCHIFQIVQIFKNYRRFAPANFMV